MNNRNRYNECYMENTQLIERPDFKNKNNLIHNNVNENIFMEKVIDHQLYVDSNDRNINVYPNPFKFVISFDTSGQKSWSGDDYYEGIPGPLINMKYRNVKYVKIDYIMLPRVVILEKTNDKYEFNDSILLSSYGYLIMKIKELSSAKIQGSNELLCNDSYVLYPNKIMGLEFMMWTPSNGSRIFNNSNLGNINKLSITIYTPDGEELSFVDTKNKKIDMCRIYNKRDGYNKEIICPRFAKTNLKCFVSIILGVMENEINTLTKYER